MTELRYCTCCKLMKPRRDFDGLYDACDGCSWCLSLGQCLPPGGPRHKHDSICCHGENHARK
jgi:hypothetical protein